MREAGPGNLPGAWEAGGPAVERAPEVPGSPAHAVCGGTGPKVPQGLPPQAASLPPGTAPNKGNPGVSEDTSSGAPHARSEGLFPFVVQTEPVLEGMDVRAARAKRAVSQAGDQTGAWRWHVALRVARGLLGGGHRQGGVLEVHLTFEAPCGKLSDPPWLPRKRAG